MATNWRVYGSETVAAVLDKAELPGFYREAIVGPNEAALVIRNGKLEEVVTEVRLGTSGFRDRLKGLIGRESDAQVIFVDTSPFDLTFCQWRRQTTVAERKCTTKGHRPAQGSAPIVQGECRPDSRSGRQGGELGRVLGRPMRRLEAGNQRSPCYA